jgi:hypothetical protein
MPRPEPTEAHQKSALAEQCHIITSYKRNLSAPKMESMDLSGLTLASLFIAHYEITILDEEPPQHSRDSELVLIQKYAGSVEDRDICRIGSTECLRRWGYGGG